MTIISPLRKASARVISILFALAGVGSTHAHCPLCTAGAAVAAGGALWLGVDKAVVALFIGAFAVSTGWWVSRMLKKEYIKYQKQVLILISFLLTVIPLLPIISTITPFYISLAGDYGSLLNRTYIINLALPASILGGLIISAGPWLSKKVTSMRSGRMLPYQGITLTLTLLIAVGVVIQVVV